MVTKAGIKCYVLSKSLISFVFCINKLKMVISGQYVHFCTVSPAWYDITRKLDLIKF